MDELIFPNGVIPQCDYCGMAIVPDPTDSESWVHLYSHDAQCIVDSVKLDAWAQPERKKDQR